MEETKNDNNKNVGPIREKGANLCVKPLNKYFSFVFAQAEENVGMGIQEKGL